MDERDWEQHLIGQLQEENREYASLIMALAKKKADAQARNAKGGRSSGAERRAQADADKARALELAEEIRRPNMSKKSLAEIVSRRLATEGIYKSPGTLRKFLVTK